MFFVSKLFLLTFSFFISGRILLDGRNFALVGTCVDVEFSNADVNLLDEPYPGLAFVFVAGVADGVVAGFLPSTRSAAPAFSHLLTVSDNFLDSFKYARKFENDKGEPFPFSFLAHFCNHLNLYCGNLTLKMVS